MISKPRTTLLVECWKEKPENENLILDAVFLRSSVQSKYDLPLPNQEGWNGGGM